MDTGATITVKSIVAAFELARERRAMERRRQRVDELFSTTSVGSATTAPAPLASNSSPTSPTTPTTLTPTAPTSIDTTKLDSTTNTEPLHAPPARCSMLGHSHGERALAPVTAVSASPSTLATASDASVAAPATSPTRCSPTCLSHENNMLKSYSVECSKPPPTSTHAEVVFDEMHQRYIITSTSAYSGSVLLCLATQVQDAQKVWEPLVVLNPVFLEPWPAIVVDMRHGQSSLNSEQHCIPPKPPWSLLCLEDDSS